MQPSNPFYSNTKAKDVNHERGISLLLRSFRIALVSRRRRPVLARMLRLRNKVITQPLEALRRDFEPRRNNRFAPRYIPLPSGPATLRLIQVHDALLAIARDAQRGRNVREQRRGILAEVREARVDAVQALVAQGIGFGEVRAQTLQVGAVYDWFGAVVGFVSQCEGFGAVGGVADVGEGLGDDGVGGEVLKWIVSLCDGCRGLNGALRRGRGS